MTAIDKSTAHILYTYVSIMLGTRSLGVKVRNLKVDFKAGGTWHRVSLGQAMNTDNEYL